MKGHWFHRVCAHPGAVAWLIGTLLVDGLLTRAAMTTAGGSLGMLFELSVLPWFIGLLLSGCLLGYIFGMMVFGLLLTRAGGFFNGAPFRVGERVIILSGKWAGQSAIVREQMIGQGGVRLLRLNLRTGEIPNRDNFFEECRVMREAGPRPDD